MSEIINYYKDCAGTYRIRVHSSGRAHLSCSDYRGNRWYFKTYKTERGAKIALGRLCGGMPTLYNSKKIESKFFRS